MWCSVKQWTVLPSLALSQPCFQAFVLYVFSPPKLDNIFHTHIEQLAGPFFLYLVLGSRQYNVTCNIVIFNFKGTYSIVESVTHKICPSILVQETKLQMCSMCGVLVHNFLKGQHFLQKAVVSPEVLQYKKICRYQYKTVAVMKGNIHYPVCS